MPAIAGLTEVLADAGWGHHGWGWGGRMMVGWWLLVGLAIFFAVRRVAPSSPAPSAGRQTALVIIGNLSGDPGSKVESGEAPDFVLPATDGSRVSLDEVIADGDALLYFSMGVGCDGCFAQIPEAANGLEAQGIQLVPVMVDPPERVADEATRFGIDMPILIDRDRSVSEAYGMLGVYGHTDRPSHSFALVRRDGTVGWVKHYATMFVPLEQLLAEMPST